MPGQGVVVTGASSGIGEAVAARLVASGRHVLGVARSTATLEALRARLGPRFEPHPLDLADPAAIDAWLDRLTQTHTRLRGLIHCAGVIVPGVLGSVAEADLERMMAVNFQGPYLLTNRLVPLLEAAGGDLIFINSSAALQPAAGRSAYTASKCALRALADTARIELNPRGIRVASIYPGRTATPGMDALFAGEKRAYDPALLLQPGDIAAEVIRIIDSPPHAEIMDVTLRPRAKSY